MKFRALLLILIFCFALIPGLVLADATVSLDNVSGDPGTDVVVPVSLSSSPQDVAAMNFTINFDSSKLEYVSVVGTSILTNAEKELESNSPSAGQVIFVIYGINQHTIADGIIANITFTINNDAGSGEIVLDMDDLVACSGEAELINSTAVDANIYPSGAVVPSITSTSSDGYYNEGDTINITVSFSQPVTLANGNLIITLETGETDSTATISSINNSSTSSGTYTVQDGDTSTDLTVSLLSLEGGATLKDTGENDVDLSTITSNLSANSNIVVDTAPPTSSAIAPSYGHGALSITWTASDVTSGVALTRLWYKRSGNGWADTGLTPQTGTSGTFTYTPTDGGGTYYFSTRSNDNAGNTEAEPTGDGDDSTTYDTIPIITTNDGNDYSTTDSSITIEGTCSSDTVTIYVNESTEDVSYTSGSTSWTYAYTLEQGVNTFNITAVDAAGNISNAGSVTIIYSFGDNNLPDKPVLSTPDNEETGVSLTPQLRTDPFSDPDEGDTHTNTRWQISSESDFSDNENYIADVEGAVHLTSLTVPEFILDKNTTYYCRVRFFDNNNGGSEWSNVHSFTTMNEGPFTDDDSNGIPDNQEVDDTVDLDEDGTSDLDENPDDYKSVNTTVGDGQIGIRKSTNVTSIELLEAIDPSIISDNDGRPEDMPLGLIRFKLNTTNIGDTAMIILYFSEEASDDAKWYRYDPVEGWEDYSAHTTFSADRKSVTLELKDGGFGDADGVANRVIVDPSGFGSVSTGGGGGGSSSGSNGCFITTAVFG